MTDDEPVHVYPAGPVEDLAHVGGSRRVKAPHHECWLCFEGLCEQRAHDGGAVIVHGLRRQDA